MIHTFAYAEEGTQHQMVSNRGVEQNKNKEKRMCLGGEGIMYSAYYVS